MAHLRPKIGKTGGADKEKSRSENADLIGYIMEVPVIKVIRFHLGNHLRLGGEGYVSTLRQMKNGSYIRTSWGGFLVDAYWKFGR